MKPEWTTEAIITHFTLQSEKQAWLAINDPRVHFTSEPRLHIWYKTPAKEFFHKN